MEQNNSNKMNALQLEKDQFLDEMTAKYIYGGEYKIVPITCYVIKRCITRCLITTCMPVDITVDVSLPA